VGILVSVLAGPILIAWLYNKLANKNPGLRIFANRFCGSLMLLCVAQFMFSNEHATKRPSMFWLTMLIPLSFLFQKKVWRTLGHILTGPTLRILGYLAVCLNLSIYVFKFAYDRQDSVSSMFTVAAIVSVLAIVYEALYSIFTNEKVKYPTLGFLILVNLIGAFALA